MGTATCLHQNDAGPVLLCDLTGPPKIKIEEQFCKECEIGRIYRDFGCKEISGEIRTQTVGLDEKHTYPIGVKTYCKRHEFEPKWQNCKDCPDKSI